MRIGLIYFLNGIGQKHTIFQRVPAKRAWVVIYACLRGVFKLVYFTQVIIIMQLGYFAVIIVQATTQKHGGCK